MCKKWNSRKLIYPIETFIVHIIKIAKHVQSLSKIIIVSGYEPSNGYRCKVLKIYFHWFSKAFVEQTVFLLSHSFYFSIYSSLCLSISVSLSLCLFLCLSVCLSVSLSLSLFDDLILNVVLDWWLRRTRLGVSRQPWSRNNIFLRKKNSMENWEWRYVNDNCRIHTFFIMVEI